MRSIVVLGDTRRHQVSIGPPNEWRGAGCGPIDGIPPTPSLGGAYMMHDAIAQALGNRLIGPENPDGIKLLSYKTVSASEMGAFRQHLHWKLVPIRRGNSPQYTLRLKPINRTDYPGLPAFPDLDPKLIDILVKPDGLFNEPISRPTEPEIKQPAFWQFPGSPDILVVDDLNIEFRQIPVNISMTSDLSAFRFEAHSIDDAIMTLSTPLPELTNWSDHQKTKDLSRLRSRRISAALLLLLQRFSRAQQIAMEHHEIPVMEPIILASLFGFPHTVFTKSTDHNTFWSVLLRSNWLRERTVLLLNAEDLRADGLAVSSGVSWERTAQDTILEMRSSPIYRRFLHFGQLIVCFGTTGALHIVKRGPADWSYYLFFSPAHDDVHWTDYDKYGCFLGSTSVITASIIESLVNHCKRAGDHPFLGDLPRSVADAMFNASRFSLKLTDDGYGAADGKKVLYSITKQLKQRTLFPSEIFNQAPDEVINVPATTVPSVVLRDWSILGQSVQTRIGEVARDIVRFGPLDTLNQTPLAPKRDFVAAIKAEIISSLEKLVQANLGKRRPEIKNLLIASTYDIVAVSIDKLKANNSLFGTRTAYFRSRIAKVSPPDDWNRLAEVIADNLKAIKSSDLISDLHRVVSLSDGEIDQIFDMHRPMFDIADAPVAPIVRYGKRSDDGATQELIIVDRREVEGYRAIEKLMRAHIDAVRNEMNDRPLSIALFGPPGSGKSSAVKRINETLADSSTRVLDAYNLSQFGGIDDLNQAFTTISQSGTGKLVPIAFFDEFDCKAFDSNAPLGWLKFFLAPMEDGIFRGSSVRNAILVFAGGTKTTFNDFSLAGRSRDDSRWIEFSDAKGPDFVSRLRGHLNIVGINPADPDDQLYLIRRALLIRSLLSSMQRLAEGNLARIDASMLRAVLHVPTYWHGGRAVRMLLELCSTGKDRVITASAVPPIQQLNMLVDGKAFLDLLNGVASYASGTP